MSVDVRPIRHFDLHNGFHFDDDPFEAFLEVRESEPFWCEDFGGFWVFTRYAQVREIMQNPGLFSHVNSGVPPVVLEQPLMPSNFDPPYQTKLRSVILPHMTAAKIAKLEPRMHDVCRELISGFKDRGSCEIGRGFCSQVPHRHLQRPLRLARGTPRGVSRFR